MKIELPVWIWRLIIGVIVIALGLLDWLTGYELNFFVFYFLPVSLAAWLLGLGTSITVAVLCAMIWAGADVLSGHIYSSHGYAVWNTVIRLISFLAIAWSIFRIRRLLAQESETAETLKQAIAEIKVLEAFLPICSQCKKIRNKEGNWQHFESYIGEHSNTQFSHSYCPECAKKAMAEAGLIDKRTKQ